MAYFDRKMALGAIALQDRTLEAEPGETVNFPYYKAIGDAQEPAETEGLEVEALEDDSFSVTVKEIGKAVGWKDKSKRVSAQRDPEAEGQRQIGRVCAEKVDKDLQTLINDSGNFVTGFTASSDAHKLTITELMQLKISCFGDKMDQAVACAMHSLTYATLITDSTAGFLKMDANDPFYGLPGFMGRLLGMALFVLDTSARVSDVGGKKTYAVHVFKANPFGIYMAEQLKFEADRDILKRENVVAATMWYGTLSLHAKVASTDLRIGRGTYASAVNA
jgi:hypothetical protein